jgi:geranylgeranyl pyrophosphate synthase
MLAFETASNASCDDSISLEGVKIISRLAGALGMCGGQTMDMHAERVRVDYEYLKKLQALKTGALIEAAARLGCICAAASGDKTDACVKFASCIGRAFQIIDDILDVEGDEKTLGKRIGSDEDSQKSTFVSELGLDNAKAEAQRLTDEAINAISCFEGSEALCELARYLLVRKN